MRPGTLFLVRPHISLLDGPVVAWRLRRAGIHAVFAVDPDYALHPVWSRLLTSYGRLTGHAMLPLDMRHPFSLRSLYTRLQSGQNVVLFPQGTGLNNPDRPDQPGAAWLIKKAGVSIPIKHIQLPANVKRKLQKEIPA